MFATLPDGIREKEREGKKHFEGRMWEGILPHCRLMTEGFIADPSRESLCENIDQHALIV